MRVADSGGTGGSTPAPAPRPSGAGSSSAAERRQTTTRRSSTSARRSSSTSRRTAGHSSTSRTTTTTHTAAASTTTSTEAMTAQEKAAEFGYTAGFFNIDPQLKDILAQAVQQNWSQARFVGALQNTNWFRTTSEAMRKYEALKISDPATLTQQMNTAQAHILTTAGQMGAALSPAAAGHLAQQAISMGWSDEQLKNVLGGMLTVTNGLYRGQAGALQDQFNQVLGDYGINVSDATMGQWVKEGVLGANSVDNVRDAVSKLAESKYAALAPRIKAGETVRQIADPYIQSYGKLLEVNPQNIGLNDPLIQRALTSKGPDGQPTSQTLYDFENTLRADPRWAKTDNARDTMATTARSILSDFGMM